MQPSLDVLGRKLVVLNQFPVPEIGACFVAIKMNGERRTVNGEPPHANRQSFLLIDLADSRRRICTKWRRFNDRGVFL